MDPSFYGLTRQQLHAIAADPRTDGATLAKLAESGPEFWSAVAAHPNAYPELLEWLQNTGDPATAAVLSKRAESHAETPSNRKRGNTWSKGVLVGLGALAIVVLGSVIALAIHFVGGKGSGGSTAEPESFALGAREAWTQTSEEMWGSEGGESAVVPHQMALAAGPSLLFGTYEQIKSVDPLTGKTLWEQNVMVPLTHCALSEGEDVLYCPLNEGASAIQALNVADGKITNIQLTATSAGADGYVEDIQLGGDGLVLYEADMVLAVDLDGTIKWQTPIETQYGENRYMMVNDTTVLVGEPSAAHETQLSLRDGQILYSGDTGGAPEFVVPHAEAGVSVDGGSCNYQVQGVVLYAPDNCAMSDTSGVATAYDDATGDPLWEIGLEGTILQRGSDRYLVVARGMHQVGTRKMQAFDSVTVYAPATGEEPANSVEVSAAVVEADAVDPGEANQVPAMIPDCPDSTILLAWAELSNGWVLVCGVSSTQPTYWASDLAGSGMQTTSDVSYLPSGGGAASAGGSDGYTARFPSGETLQLDYQPAGVSQIDRAGTPIGQFKVLIIYFVELGQREVPDGEMPSSSLASVAPSTRTPETSSSQTGSTSSGSHPSTAYCPAGSYTTFEGETEGFYVSICGNSGGGFTYVGLGRNGGVMVLPAEFYDGIWVASNESHTYAVTESRLRVVENATNSDVVDQTVTPVR